MSESEFICTSKRPIPLDKIFRQCAVTIPVEISDTKPHTDGILSMSPAKYGLSMCVWKFSRGKYRKILSLAMDGLDAARMQGLITDNLSRRIQDERR